MDVSDEIKSADGSAPEAITGQGNEQSKTASIGCTLRQARENLKLSEQDIASKLNITVAVVQNIEADAPGDDLPMTFVRGYIRSYAVKVGLDGQMIQTMLERQYGTEQPEIHAVKTISPWRVKRRELNASSGWFKALTVLIVVALLGLGGWEAWKRLGKSEDVAASSRENSISLDLAGADNLTSPNESTSGDSSQLVNDEGDDIAAPATTDIASATGSADGQVSAANSKPGVSQLAANRTAELASSENSETPGADSRLGQGENLPPALDLVFDFTGDCWVEVVDATGEVIAVGIKHRGKHMPIKGVPPINIKLGAPGNVSLLIGGEPWDLSTYKPDRTASFTIGG